jgi:hypothetical protein
MLIRRVAALAAVVVAGACGPRSERLSMRSENNSGQNGFALLTALSANSTRVEVDLSAPLDRQPQPAHVHEGRCGEIGPIRAGLDVLEASPAKPDRFVSTSDVQLGLEQLFSSPFAINVHDARDLSLYVSCGGPP